MNYLYSRVEEAEFKESTPLRRSLRAHLKKVSEALRAVEWVDSGDWGPGDEDGPIRELLAPGAELAQLLIEGRALVKRLAEVVDSEAKKE